MRPPGRTGRVTLLIDPVSAGPTQLDIGLEQIDVGGRIPTHRHAGQEETLFFLAGEGLALVDQEQFPIRPGAAVYIPRGMWHGVVNTGHEPLRLLWSLTPPGLSAFFREIARPAGAPPDPMTTDEFVQIARRHGMEVRL
jgi:quercetin dioxygenase-like cupin family protein